MTCLGRKVHPLAMEAERRPEEGSHSFPRFGQSKFRIINLRRNEYDVFPETIKQFDGGQNLPN